MRVSTISLLVLLTFCALIAAGCGGGPEDAAKELAAACERQIDEIAEAKSESTIEAAKSSEERESQERTVQCAGQAVEAPVAATDGETKDAAADGEDAGTPTPATEIDPEARDMFTEKCASCHALAEAKATGAVGPNLDELKLTAETITKQIENGGGAMPPGLLTGDDAAKVGAYVAAASEASAG